jgi:hypothetical protein
MRFRVEVTPLGGQGSASESFVEAESWRAALERVRMLRGETGEASSLSIEAVEGGHRVIDASRMLRYVIDTATSREGTTTVDVLMARDSEPTEAVPLAYRERAVRLTRPASREAVQDVLEELLATVRGELAAHPFGKVIELGVFAHDARDTSAPLGTLSFKDWRGEFAELWLSDALPTATRQVNSEKPPASGAGPGSVAPRSAGGQPSEPPPTSRRRPTEDLIADLFDSMHALDFVPDVITGVTFVLNILERMLPSRVSAVHVFDIGRRCFVLTGARGIPEEALGSRLPETDPFFRWLRSHGRTRRLEGAQVGVSVVRGHFKAEPPKRLMATAVQFGGRDLGVLELGDPQGREPYSEHEAAALDYIAERLGGFLAARPIVLDEELFTTSAEAKAH